MIKSKKNNIDYLWIIKIVLISFIISVFFSFVSEMTIPKFNILFGILICLLFIFIGIVFDMIGVSVTASDESIFNSMAAKKIRGAKLAVKFKKKADKVSSFCNDVVGDICGIISGSAGAVIALRLSQVFSINPLIITLLVTGLISAITIGGKALVKGMAIRRSNKILYRFALVLSIFYRSR